MMVLLVLLTAYVLTIGWLCWGFTRMAFFEANAKMPKTAFTIVAPFRNEAHRIDGLLASLQNLNYPDELLEIILVDDDSTDGFQVPEGPWRAIPNQRRSASPKKDAIVNAIETARHPWIVTTDADCIVPENWLLLLDAFIQQSDCELVAGPVAYSAHAPWTAGGIKPGWGVGAFQQTDLAALQGVTMASFGWRKPFMCNGANLAYSRRLFAAVDGFAGNENHPGGDDVFLLQKVAKLFPEKIGYLKNPDYVVKTAPEPDWNAVFWQRVRWAAKSGGYTNVTAKILGAVALLGNAAWIIGLVACVAGRAPWMLVLLVGKIAVDALLIAQANTVLQQKTTGYWWQALWYPFFSVGVALAALAGGFEWKGRRYSRTRRP